VGIPLLHVDHFVTSICNKRLFVLSTYQRNRKERKRE